MALWQSRSNELKIASLHDRALQQKSFRQVLLSHADWLEKRPDGVRANLSGAVFSDMKIPGLNLSRAILRGAVFLDAELPDANFSGAILDAADFRQAIL